MKSAFSELANHKNGIHIFYSIKEIETYLTDLVSFILAGVEQGDHVLVIESEKILPMLNKKLKPLLSHEQLSYMHTVNNFDYYCLNGSFQPRVIFENLSTAIKSFNEKNSTFRAWAHVEWAEQEGISAILERFEREADNFVAKNGLYIVCAYDDDRVPSSLKTKLMKYHEYVLTENRVVPSAIYDHTNIK
ncbi:3-ketoacyl-ACP reductase [Priestia megaterium]|nr:3-ketoacyl-ACP reductase [Priestia megaterium]